MIRRLANAAIVVVSCLGLVALTAEPLLRAEPTDHAPVAARQFSERMGCPAWRNGLSRSVTIIATEDAAGALTGMQCIRTRDRGMVRRPGA